MSGDSRGFNSTQVEPDSSPLNPPLPPPSPFLFSSRQSDNKHVGNLQTEEGGKGGGGGRELSLFDWKQIKSLNKPHSCWRQDVFPDERTQLCDAVFQS